MVSRRASWRRPDVNRFHTSSSHCDARLSTIMSKLLSCLCLIDMLIASVRAGAPAARLQKVVLLGENKDSLAELLEADRLVDPKPSPQVLAAIAGLGGMPGPLGPLAALALERINEQQWAEAMEEYQRLI